MTSRKTKRFNDAFLQLPSTVQQQAKVAYKQFLSDPSHPSLRFKPVNSKKTVYSVRINVDYRALGTKKDDMIIWFWIGSHQQYDKILKSI